MKDEEQLRQENARCLVKPDILSAEDIMNMAPQLAKHPKLVKWLMHLLWFDKCNATHARWCFTTGAPFARHLVEDEFKFKLRVDNIETLQQFPQGAFITVSNHPFGSYDGIILLHLVSQFRPDYKVMVNLILNNIQAMRPSFIPVDSMGSNDPEKKKISIEGVRQTLQRLKDGHPVGFFPAGAVSKLNRHLRLEDRPWQPTLIRIIQKANVPVIPIFFHGSNSALFNIMGVLAWQLRTLMLPRELYHKIGNEVHISVGNPIMPDTISSFTDFKELGNFLKTTTYSLRNQ